MILKLISTVVILCIVYVLLVFLAPALADTIGKTTGTTPLNAKIRETKGKVDAYIALRAGMASSGSVASTLSGVTNTIDTTKRVLNKKAEQIGDVADTAQQVAKDVRSTAQHIENLQSKVHNVASLTGANE